MGVAGVGNVSPESIESMDMLRTAWRMAVLDRDPGADVRDLEGVAVRWADCRFLFWNCVTLTDVGADADLLARRMADAAAVMREKERAGLLWVFEDLVAGPVREDIDGIARRAGLVAAFPGGAAGVGMAMEPAGIAEPVHPELTFERVLTEEQLLAYADINSRAYGMELADGRDGIGGSEWWKSGVHAYLGVRAADRTPVSAAAAVAAAGRLFVLLVATLPEWERRGYAEAVTRKAVYEGAAATGLKRAALHATPAGAPVYPRIGFVPNSPVRFYALAG